MVLAGIRGNAFAKDLNKLEMVKFIKMAIKAGLLYLY